MDFSDDQFIEWSLSHQKDYYTYVTFVSFHGRRDTSAFFNQIKGAANKLSKRIQAKELQLDMVGMAFGAADVVLLWRAKTLDAAKEFADTVLTGDGNVSNTIICVPVRTYDKSSIP